MTAIFEPPDTTTQLARFSPTDTAIATLAKEYLPLHIADVNDTHGYTLVHRARMDIKAKRVSVEKVRKDLKADALDYGRKVDAEAKRLTTLLEPIELHLESEETSYEAAKEAIRNAARLKAEAEAKAIADAEAARVKAEHDAEVERLRVEREKLDAERKTMEAEQARIAAEQRAAQEKIDAERRAVEAEQKRLADIEAARLRAIEMEKAKAEAAEKARTETEARIARETAAKAAAEKLRAEVAEATRIKAEALRPDREKLLAVADAVQALEVPGVSPDAVEAWGQVCVVLKDAEQQIRSIVDDMVKPTAGELSPC